MPGKRKASSAVKSIKKSKSKSKAKASKYISKKKAYKPKIKETQVRRRAPIVETKTRTDQEVWQRMHTPVNAYYNQNPVVFHSWPHAGDKVFPLKLFCLDNQVQGIGEDMLTGNSSFVKYMKCKVQLKFPSGLNTPSMQPDIYIVHGFIKKSPNLNGANTVETVTNPGDWAAQNDWDFIRTQLTPYFNDREDKLAYIPKKDSHVKILDYHRVKPKQRIGFGRPRQTVVDTQPEPTRS